MARTGRPRGSKSSEDEHRLMLLVIESIEDVVNPRVRMGGADAGPGDPNPQSIRRGGVKKILVLDHEHLFERALELAKTLYPARCDEAKARSLIAKTWSRDNARHAKRIEAGIEQLRDAIGACLVDPNHEAIFHGDGRFLPEKTIRVYPEAAAVLHALGYRSPGKTPGDDDCADYLPKVKLRSKKDGTVKRAGLAQGPEFETVRNPRRTSSFRGLRQRSAFGAGPG